MWGSSRLGERFTGTPAWQLSLDGFALSLHSGGKTYEANISDSAAVQTTPGYIWSSVRFQPANAPLLLVDGISNRSATAMMKAILSSQAQFQAGERKRKKLETFDRVIEPIVAWRKAVTESVQAHKANHRWIAEETFQAWMSQRDRGATGAAQLTEFFKDPEFADYLKTKNEEVRYAIDLWRTDLRATVKVLNEKHLVTELDACRDFFNTVEKSPLTDEQARAVVCFDNRVLVIASAGSGKTSTMVAKAGYALHRGLVSADRILLLAYNKEAAKELQQRVHERLSPAHAVAARTFHAFGLDVIGNATGKKPGLAPWLEGGKNVEHLSALIDELKGSNQLFRMKWDLFRVVFGRDLPQFGKEAEGPEDRDRNTKKYGFRTLRDDVVKSHGERMIADWLFYNGVEYRYEPPYEHDTASASHRQYTPDFYYPGIKLYHEHLALDHAGQPPADFKGYLEGVEWKRGLHRQHGTSLIETTSAQLRTGKAFAILEAELTKRGIKLDPNPDRPVQGRRPIEHEELIKVFRTFLTHAKSNRLHDGDLRERLKTQAPGGFTYRHELFLDLFEEVRTSWEKSLRDKRCIDFEDMLNLAADHMEAARWHSPYDLVMVDEFQDASGARARLTRALVSKPGRFLFAVGDDWQSINRFAGADISVMTKFEEWFGRGETVRLERTFRCPQSLCDVSSQFVLKNPAQMTKKVKSGQTEYPPTLLGFQVDEDAKLQGAVSRFLADLCQQIASGAVAPARKGKLFVFVLGRYKKDREYIPDDWEEKYGKYLSLKFSSVHGSKGLEADYVILPRMVRGMYSFPSTIEDDPVLQLAMPSDDIFLYGEERRLFYVALTRARRSVIIFTVEARMSPFVVELIGDLKLQMKGIDGKESKAVPCPKCKQGMLTKRTGPYSEFLGCGRYPSCDYRQKIGRKAYETAP